MIASQAFGALVLPVTVACFIYVGNKKSLMGEFTFKPVVNIVLAFVFLFAVTMSYMSYTGLISMMKDLI